MSKKWHKVSSMEELREIEAKEKRQRFVTCCVVSGISLFLSAILLVLRFL